MIKKLITRPIAVTMSVIAIMVMSLVAMGYLPVSLMPAINIPQITVQVAAPGMSVREIDNVLLKPLKNQLSQVAGLKNITAEARADIGTIYMDFEPDCNIDIVFIDVNEKMDRAITSLPKDVERPKVIKASVTDIPAFYLNLSLKNGIPGKEGELREAGIEFSELGQFARDVISKRIEQLPQTAMVDISGVVTPELLCIPNYAKLTSMGADISLLEQAINNNNVSLGALSIKDGQYRYLPEVTYKEIRERQPEPYAKYWLFPDENRHLIRKILLVPPIPPPIHPEKYPVFCIHLLAEPKNVQNGYLPDL